MPTLDIDVYHPSPNFWPGRAGNLVSAVVNHISGGNIAGLDSWFRNSASQVSAHFAIDRWGHIWQYVFTGNTAWANGLYENPDLTLPWLKDAFNRGINPNRITCSIEHIGFPGIPLTELQIATSIRVNRYCCEKFDIPKDRQHIIGHYQITGNSRANCPGNAFPFDQIIDSL